VTRCGADGNISDNIDLRRGGGGGGISLDELLAGDSQEFHLSVGNFDLATRSLGGAQ